MTEDSAWVVGDLKKDDALVLPEHRAALWQDKRECVDGLTRFALFLIAHCYPWQAVRPCPIKACMEDRFR